MNTTKLDFKTTESSVIAFLNDDYKRDASLYNVMQSGHLFTLPGYRIQRSGYDSFALVAVNDGRLNLYFGSEKYTAGRGDFIFFDQKRPHILTNEYDEICDMHFLYMFGGGNGIRDIFEKIRKVYGCVIQNYRPSDFADITMEICNAINAGTQDEYKTSVELYSILTDILRHTRSQEIADINRDNEISYVIKYIRSHFDKNIKLDELARMFFADKYGLIRKFHTRTGYTPKEYQNNLRFQTACKLLKNSDMSVTDIAKSVGFNDARGLIAMFAKRVDCSPLQYRKNNR